MFESIQPSLSVQEYLDLEKSSKERHENIGGHLYAIAEASQRHSRITGNIFTALWALSNGLGCRIFQNGMRLRIGEATFYYPDVMVVCEQEEPDPYFEVNPCILIEVLSPSTKTVDLREKMLEYKRLPSLHTYLIIDPESLFVRHLWRDEEGVWQQEGITGSGDLPLPYLNATLSLSQIYRNVFN